MVGYLKDSLRRERMKREAFELEMKAVVARLEVIEAQMLIVREWLDELRAEREARHPERCESCNALIAPKR